MRVEAEPKPPLGSLVRLVPTHVCPTVNLADEAVLIEGGQMQRIVPVRARGHETLGSGGGAMPNVSTSSSKGKRAVPRGR